MIAVVEPQCLSFSHEKVNSGLLACLRKAFPHEKIVLYAHRTHIEALKAMFDRDGVEMGDIEYCHVEFKPYLNPFVFLGYFLQLFRIFKKQIRMGNRKFFFLSYNSPLLFVLQKLTGVAAFKDLKMTLVMHGGFEKIATEAPPSVSLRVSRFPSVNTGMREKLRKNGIIGIFRKLPKLIWNRYFSNFWVSRMDKWFPESSVLLNPNPDHFRFLALSPHILSNVKKLIPELNISLQALVLPTVFAKPKNTVSNKYPKFAVFGYGNSIYLHNLLLHLQGLKIHSPYEIRVISMDIRGTQGFPNVTCPSEGKTMTRSEMENYAFDIDMFLILYDQNRYRLSCSASILESMSYLKPVLHLQNECIDFFNQPDLPIGISTKSLEEMALEIKNIAENYPAFQENFENFRSNIFKLREVHSIERSSVVLRETMAW